MNRRSLVMVTASSLALATVIVGCGKNEIATPGHTIPAAIATGKPCVAALATPPATTPPGTDATGGTTPPGTIDKPKVNVPVGDPPKELKIEDLKVGEGAEVKAGDSVTAHYTGVSCSTGKQFDSSWDRGEPATFSLAQVIKGWQTGLVGMKVGGRRQLVVPPDQGYGNTPKGDDILPGETLVFVIDLVKTETPPATTTTAAPAPGSTAAPTGSEAPTTAAPGSTAAATTTAAPTTVAPTTVKP